MTQTGHILLIDASGFAFRAYHVGAHRFRDDGLPTWAIEGFLTLVWKVIGAASADPFSHGAAVFDAPGKTFRHDLYPRYKKNRPARDEELSVQMPYLRHASDALGLTPVEREGFEADDVLCTLAYRARDAGMRVSLVSSDKDMCGLVIDDWIEIIDPVKHVRIRSADVEKKFKVPPSMVAAVQALAGDSVDNIPGVPGMGIERAAAMMRRFGSLEEVLANASKCRWPQLRTQLKRHAENVRLYLQLTTLRRDVPLDVTFDHLRAQPIMRSHLVEIVRALGAEKRFESIFGLEQKTARVVPPMIGAKTWHREELLAPGQKLPEIPQVGWYQRTLVKGGVRAPARIWREPQIGDDGKPTGNDILRCEVDGKPRDPYAEWARLSMAPITESEFLYGRADSEHAKKYRPGDPRATPQVAIDLRKAPVSRNPKAKRKRA